MAGAGTGGSDDTVSAVGGGLYTFTTDVSWILVTSHSMLQPDGDWLVAVQLNPSRTRVAIPCVLLWMDPARRNPGSLRLFSETQCVSCRRTTATLMETARCLITSSLAMVRPSTLSWSTDRPWFSMVGVSARPAEDVLCLGLDLGLPAR